MNDSSLQEDFSIQQVAKLLFSKPPQEKKSIVINFAPDSDVFSPDDSPEQMFFTDLALLGINMLWKHENIMQMTKQEFNVLQQYMESVGVRLIVTCNDNKDNPWETVEKNENVEFLRFKVVFI